MLIPRESSSHGYTQTRPTQLNLLFLAKWLSNKNRKGTWKRTKGFTGRIWSSLWFLTVSSLTVTQSSINICQTLEEVPCTHCMVWPHGAVRVTTHMPKPVHTKKKASSSRGSEWMDNHLLQRKMLRQEGITVICILPLISAVILYCI